MPAGQVQYQTTGTAELDVYDYDVCQDVVLVDPILEETSKGGILIADVGDAQKVRHGLVIACGPGRYNDEGHFMAMEFRVGDLVVYGQFQSGGEPITINGRRYLCFRQGDFVMRKKRDSSYFGPKAA